MTRFLVVWLVVEFGEWVYCIKAGEPGRPAVQNCSVHLKVDATLVRAARLGRGGQREQILSDRADVGSYDCTDVHGSHDSLPWGWEILASGDGSGYAGL